MLLHAFHERLDTGYFSKKIVFMCSEYYDFAYYSTLNLVDTFQSYQCHFSAFKYDRISGFKSRFKSYLDSGVQCFDAFLFNEIK